MTEDLAVQIAEPADVPAIHELLYEFNGAALPAEELKRRMEHAPTLETVFLGKVGGKMGGLLVLRIVPALSDPEDWCEITEMYVRPPFRRKGLGTALVQAALEYGRGRACKEAHLLVDPLNQGALAFYQAIGFRHDSCEMRRDITP
jgi:ribosomal protein S18 acetylase RimI-like enzyme